MIYYKNNTNYFAQSTKFDDFYCKLLKTVKENWKRNGNGVLNISDSKVSRLFAGKQKDFEMLLKMAKFLGMSYSFKLY